MCKILGIAKSRTTPYHPQSDGLVERFNRTLFNMLATAATDYPFEWQHHLRPLCMAYNTSVYSTTGYTPFYLMFGRPAKMPIDIAYGQPQPSEAPSPATYASELHNRLQDEYERVRKTLGHNLDLQKQVYDQKSPWQSISKRRSCMDSLTCPSERLSSEVASALDRPISCNKDLRYSVLPARCKFKTSTSCCPLQPSQTLPTKHSNQRATES